MHQLVLHTRILLVIQKISFAFIYFKMWKFKRFPAITPMIKLSHPNIPIVATVEISITI